MADVIVSAVAERIIAMVEEQIRNEVNLVRGVEEEVLKLSEELKRLRNVLNDAENRRFKDKNINYWLSRLEQTSYEMEDVLDEWSYALLKNKMDQSNPPKQKVCSFVPSSSCLCFKKVVVRRDIANKIKNVKERLDLILKEKDQFNFITSQPTMDPTPESWRVQSTSLIDLGNVHGRDKDKDILVSKLTGNGGRDEELGNLQVVSIVGVGGLGKTTLAQLVYNDSLVKGSFELRIWICVSDPFDLAAIAKGILESLREGISPNTNQLDVLFKHVQDSISGKRFLLVLDDVWTEDYNKWESLENALGCGGVGSKILVTTRKERVAQIIRTIHVHRPGQLSDEDCWLLMRRMTPFGKTNEVFENFEDIGRKIAKKCKGLPLAAKVLGSLLCSKNTLEEWEDVLNNEIWEMKEVKVELFPHLLLSYNELSPTLKRCFSYCAVFPKDKIIDLDELITSWMALGYLGSEGDVEGKGREYFNILMMHSLIQDFKKDYWCERIQFCKMHDIVHDFAQFVRKSDKVEATRMNKITCQTCDPLLVSNVNEFCTLFLNYEGSPLNLCYCLKRLRVLSLHGLESIPQGIENMIHLRSLSLNEIKQLSPEALKIIFQLYNLQTLCLKDCALEEIPMEVKNLIHLRHLDLSGNGYLKELPREIGDLIQLRHLNLCETESLKELPREIGDLIQLRHLNLSGHRFREELPREIGNLIHLRHLDLYGNSNLKELPESICALNLRTLDVRGCIRLSRLPDGVGQLISLRRLGEFYGGSRCNKLRSLKNLNNLSESLKLNIELDKDINSEEMVEDAKEAQLRNKIHIQSLKICFVDEMDENEESSMVRMNVIDALEPHPKLEALEICYYEGSQLPLSWLVSPLNQLRKLCLSYHYHLTSLPPLGKLPCLEELRIYRVCALQFVGRELLGIGRGGDMELDTVAFPKLKELKFIICDNWKEWEDITIQEEESARMTLMPCLTHLYINCCNSLTVLPHGLLRKVSTLKVLDISVSRLLKERYGDKDGSDWKSISQYNPRLQLKFSRNDPLYFRYFYPGVSY